MFRYIFQRFKFYILILSLSAASCLDVFAGPSSNDTDDVNTTSKRKQLEDELLEMEVKKVKSECEKLAVETELINKRLKQEKELFEARIQQEKELFELKKTLIKAKIENVSAKGKDDET